MAVGRESEVRSGCRIVQFLPPSLDRARTGFPKLAFMLSGPDPVREFWDFATILVSKCTKLRKLSVHAASVPTSTIIDELSHLYTRLEELDMSHMAIGEAEAAQLSDRLEGVTKLTSLDLSRNRMKSDDLDRIVYTLACLRAGAGPLHYLVLERAAQGPCHYIIAEHLAMIDGLHVLALGSLDLENKEKWLFELSQIRSLGKLHLNDIFFDEAALKSLARWLPIFDALSELTMPRFARGSLGYVEMIAAFGHCMVLRTIRFVDRLEGDTVKVAIRDIRQISIADCLVEGDAAASEPGSE